MPDCVESGIAYFVAIVLTVRYMTVKKKSPHAGCGLFWMCSGIVKFPVSFHTKKGNRPTLSTSASAWGKWLSFVFLHLLQ